MTTFQTTPRKGNAMAAARGVDIGPDIALQALLAHDLTAFTNSPSAWCGQVSNSSRIGISRR
jgi:hypothetical protein